MVLIHDLNKKMQQDILNGVFDSTLPSIRLLAQRYNVGASTMKLSLKQLKEDGFLIGHQGKCIRVNPLVLDNRFFQKNIIVFIKLPRLGLRLYVRIIESLREAFETNGAYVHLVNSVQQLKSRKIDADIIIATEIKGEDMQYIADNYPAEKIILLNGYSDKYASVGTDNFQAGYEAIKYLHEEKNHKNIGILSMYFDYELSFNKFRRDGANEYCRQHPEVKLFEADAEKFTSNNEAVEYLFAKNADISAVFATMDTLAFSVYSYAAKNNITIPSQLTVLGFDNSNFCDFTIPPLSSFAEDAEGITQQLLTLTKNKLTEDNDKKQYLFSSTLIKRQSVCKTLTP